MNGGVLEPVLDQTSQDWRIVDPKLGDQVEWAPAAASSHRRSHASLGGATLRPAEGRRCRPPANYVKPSYLKQGGSRDQHPTNRSQGNGP